MRIPSPVKWVTLAVVLCLLGGAGFVYLQASRVPSAYRYHPLSRPQRRQAATDFYNRLADFNRYAQDTEPFSWSIGEERLNRYLASMEEIAAIRPGHRAGSVVESLRQAGVADPVISLEDDRLRVMLRLTEHHKILSVTLGLEFTADRRLRVKLLDTALGSLPVPESMVHEHLATLRNSLSETNGAPSPGDDGNPTGQVADVVSAIIRAIDREPIEPVGTWDHRQIRVYNITIAPDRLTLQVRRATEGS